MRALLLAMFCAGCGADDQPQQGASMAAPTQQTPSVDSAGLMAVNEIPICDLAANGRVIYVIPTKSFKTCDATTGTWYAIEVKGEDGQRGEAGAAGQKGDQGDAGAAGATGADGAKGDTGAVGAQGSDGNDGPKGDRGDKGDAGKVVSDSEWIDPISAQAWTRTKGLTSDPAGICDGDYRLPTSNEIRIAVLRGMCNVANMCSVIWSSNAGKVAPTGAAVTANEAAPFCIEVTQ